MSDIALDAEFTKLFNNDELLNERINDAIELATQMKADRIVSEFKAFCQAL